MRIPSPPTLHSYVPMRSRYRSVRTPQDPPRSVLWCWNNCRHNRGNRQRWCNDRWSDGANAVCPVVAVSLGPPTTSAHLQKKKKRKKERKKKKRRERKRKRIKQPFPLSCEELEPTTVAYMPLSWTMVHSSSPSPGRLTVPSLARPIHSRFASPTMP